MQPVRVADNVIKYVTNSFPCFEIPQIALPPSCSKLQLPFAASALFLFSLSMEEGSSLENKRH